MSPLPVIACGGSNPQIFNAVKPLYLPEYESKGIPALLETIN